MAARGVVFEDRSHAGRKFRIVDEGIDLEIVFETTEIHVRRADDGQPVVDNQQFGVQETGFVEEYFHPGFHHVVEVGVRRQVDDLRIGARREHQPNINAGQRRHL